MGTVGLFDDRKQWSRVSLIALAALCFGYALYIAARYAAQAPLDEYSFRQSQTALTAYWLARNGFSLAYETPVAGAPWSIPFEFPIYQFIVAMVSRATTCSLDVAGRMVSFVFLALCLLPARSITRSLGFKDAVFYVFAALLLSSPLYLYWGRSFMIETAAVFFSIAGIKYFIDLQQGKRPILDASLFVFFISLSILQKATTGLPVLAVLGLVFAGQSAVGPRPLRTLFSTRNVLTALLCFGIPLLVGIAWTLYTDQVKSHNPLGIRLTSAALSHWNWGTLAQRVSPQLYLDVIWGRMIERNLGGLLGVALLTLALVLRGDRKSKIVIVVSLVLGLVPLFLFSNLHLIHNYYQTGNLIFLIYALSVALGQLISERMPGKPIVLILAASLVASNYFWFSKEMLPIVKKVYDRGNSREFAVGEALRKRVPEGKVFVAFGNDWSSTFAYMAQRKSFTVPGFFASYNRIARHPELFVDEGQLGAVVLCPGTATPTVRDLNFWSTSRRRWRIETVGECLIATPDSGASIGTSMPVPRQCEGNLETAQVYPSTTGGNLHVGGWTTVSGKEGQVAEKVYVTLVGHDARTNYYEALPTDRPDVAAFFGKTDGQDMGFVRDIATTNLAGSYVVGVARLYRGRTETCQFSRSVTIGSPENE